ERGVGVHRKPLSEHFGVRETVRLFGSICTCVVGISAIPPLLGISARPCSTAARATPVVDPSGEMRRLLAAVRMMTAGEHAESKYVFLRDEPQNQAPALSEGPGDGVVHPDGWPF